MKKVLMIMFIVLLMGGCASSKPDVVSTNEDNATIGTISDDTTASTNNQTQSDSTKITAEMEEFKALVDEAMLENFDDYGSYYDSEGALNLEITTEGIVDMVMEARNGNQELIDSWNEMIESLIASNNTLVESAKLFNLENPSVVFNILNDANKEKLLLCIRNGEVEYDVLLDE